jgi:hypothetical protein
MKYFLPKVDKYHKEGEGALRLDGLDVPIV